MHLLESRISCERQTARRINPILRGGQGAVPDELGGAADQRTGRVKTEKIPVHVH